MEFNNRLPIYIQIMDDIKLSILKGELTAGDQVPSVREIAERLQVNPNTVQRAYLELRRENLLFSKRGLGNFITLDQDRIDQLRRERAENALKDFMNKMKILGLSQEETIELINKYWAKSNKA